ncbi:MAG TPA: CHASE3 domain-containing protein, partial [Chitinophagaceae bacterium]|nr:CHASE3 domain-containing protein [Chitinophagaceae bacterium]
RLQFSGRMKQSLFKKRIRTGYTLSFVLLLLSYILLFYVQQKQVKEAAWVTHSYQVTNTAELLKTKLTEAEAGARGYVITQDSIFLQPYHQGLKEIPGILGELKTLVSDNTEQTKRLDSIGPLVDRRITIMANGLANFQANGFVINNEWKQQRQVGKISMDSLRLYIARLTLAEQKLMNDREQNLSDLFKGAKIMAIVSLVIIFGALVYSLITLNMENKEKERAVKRADQYEVDLESNKSVLMEKDIELKEFKDMEKFTTTGRIARTIAHEVRNPLTNILLATDQLKESGSVGKESTVLLDLINRNANRINQLVSDLLAATRFTQLDFVNVPINQLLEETLEMAKDRVGLNRISIEKNYANEKYEVSVDREKIKVALLNIVVNAIEAMDNEPDKRLVITTKQDNDKYVIEIKDHGKGMDGEILQKLFDPYFTTKAKGNGLGLTNSQSIILNHNGRINVYSKPGEGTLFLIELNPAEEQKQ